MPYSRSPQCSQCPDICDCWRGCAEFIGFSGPGPCCAAWLYCETVSFCSTGIARGTCGQLLLICPVDLHPLQACLLCLGSVHAEQWRSTPCLCSNWLNIRPVCAIRNRLFALVCAWRSASSVRRCCRLIGSSIISGGGIYSKPGRGRLICQWGWKSIGTIAI